MISYEQTKIVLTYIYEHSLRPIAETSQLDVRAIVKMHVLGIAETELISNKLTMNTLLTNEQSNTQVYFFGRT